MRNLKTHETQTPKPDEAEQAHISVGADILGDQLIGEDVILGMVSEMDRLQGMNDSTSQSIVYHRGLREKSLGVTAMHEDKIDDLRAEQNFIAGSRQSVYEGILGSVRLAGDDDYLEHAIGLLSASNPQFRDTSARHISQYIAAKLFEKGDLEQARAVLGSKSEPPGYELQRVGALLVFMFSSGQPGLRGVDQPIMYLDYGEGEFEVKSGITDEFKMIGSPRLTGDRLEKLGLVDLSESLPTNSFIFSTKTFQEQQPLVLLITSDDIAFSEDEAVYVASIVPAFDEKTPPVVVAGYLNIQAVMDSLLEVGENDDEDKSEREKKDFALEKMAVSLHNQGLKVGTDENSELRITKDHIERSIRNRAIGCASRISDRVISDNNVRVGTYLGGEKKLQLREKGRLQKFRQTFTSTDIDVYDLVSQAITEEMGTGYVDVYLAGDKQNYAHVVSAIVSKVEEDVRTKAGVWETDITRLVEVCDFLRDHVKMQMQIDISH